MQWSPASTLGNKKLQGTLSSIMCAASLENQLTVHFNTSIYIFCCCTLFIFFFGHCLSRIGWSGAHRYYTNSVAPGVARKIATDIRPMLPPVFTGEKRPKFWPKFWPQSSSNRSIFELWHFIGKQKQTCQGPMIDLPTHQTWGGWVPQPPEPLAQWAPQRVNVENFLYILHSSGPRRVQRHQCYTTCWGCTCCKKATVPYLPSRPLQFTGGSPKRVKWKISYISSVPAAHAEYSATNVIPPVGACLLYTSDAADE